MKWVKVRGPTQLSGTAKVTLGGEALTLPPDARYIAGIMPYVLSPGGPTAGEPILAKISLDMDVANLKPAEALAQPIGSSLGKSGIQPQFEAKYYPLNIPVKGGSKLTVYGEGLIDHTIEPYAGCTIVLTDYRPGPQAHCKVGKAESTGTSAGEVKGEDIRLEGGSMLRAVIATVVGTTVASTKGILGKMRIGSSGLKGMGDLEFMLEGVPGVIATDASTASAQEVSKLTWVDVEAPITDPVDLSPYFTLGVALSTAGKWVVGFLYT